MLLETPIDSNTPSSSSSSRYSASHFDVSSSTTPLVPCRIPTSNFSIHSSGTKGMIGSESLFFVPKFANISVLVGIANGNNESLAFISIKSSSSSQLGSTQGGNVGDTVK